VRRRAKNAGIDPFGRDKEELGSQRLDVAPQRRGDRRQSKTPHAPVFGIGAALDEAELFEPIDQTGDGHGRELGNCSKLVLGQLRLAVQPRKDRQLRESHAMLLGELIAIDAHVTGDVRKQNQQVVFEIKHGFRLTR
jgi:hypothetical protein